MCMRGDAIAVMANKVTAAHLCRNIYDLQYQKHDLAFDILHFYYSKSGDSL